MKDLIDYLSLAENVITKYGYKGMHLDEDAISYVAYYMMCADNRYDGRGSRKGWVISCGKYGIKNYINRFNRSKHKKYESARVEDFEYEVCLKDVNPTFDAVVHNDIINHIKSAKYLSDMQKNCIIKYYIDGRTLKSIGQELGISHQGVAFSIKTGLNKVRQHVG